MFCAEPLGLGILFYYSIIFHYIILYYFIIIPFLFVSFRIFVFSARNETLSEHPTHVDYVSEHVSPLVH